MRSRAKQNAAQRRYLKTINGKAKRKAWFLNHRKMLNELVKKRKSLGCAICGEKDNRCLDFHHTSGKEMNISRSVRLCLSKERIISEIDKCVVVCANCHRKIHGGQE